VGSRPDEPAEDLQQRLAALQAQLGTSSAALEEHSLRSRVRDQAFEIEQLELGLREATAEAARERELRARAQEVRHETLAQAELVATHASEADAARAQLEAQLDAALAREQCAQGQAEEAEAAADQAAMAAAAMLGEKELLAQDGALARLEAERRSGDVVEQVVREAREQQLLLQRECESMLLKAQRGLQAREAEVSALRLENSEQQKQTDAHRRAAEQAEQRAAQALRTAEEMHRLAARRPEPVRTADAATSPDPLVGSRWVDRLDVFSGGRPLDASDGALLAQVIDARVAPTGAHTEYTSERRSERAAALNLHHAGKRRQWPKHAAGHHG
jgi:hypothetical protein